MDARDRRKRVEAEAAEWWLVLGGTPSRPDREQYVDWLRESPTHVAEMLRIAQLHGMLEQFERWAQLPAGGGEEAADSVARLPGSLPDPVPERLMASTPARSVRAIWPIAVILLLAAVLGTLAVINSRGQILQTDRGERRDIALADGSVVDLDPQTRVRVRYEANARYIFLERGRALFHVAKNPNRPFWVQAESTRVRAVGTAFAVDREQESIVVTVAEGKVAVFRGPEAPPTASASAPAQLSTTPFMRAIFLTADQQITVNGSGVAEPVRQVDSNRALAWAYGRLIFEHESVEDAVREFNRYNRIQVRIDYPELMLRPISGVFNASDPDSFVAFIKTVTRVRVRTDDTGNITIESPQ